VQEFLEDIYLNSCSSYFDVLYPWPAQSIYMYLHKLFQGPLLKIIYHCKLRLLLSKLVCLLLTYIAILPIVILQSVILLSVIIPSVILPIVILPFYYFKCYHTKYFNMHSVTMLGIIPLGVATLNVITASVAILGVVAPSNAFLQILASCVLFICELEARCSLSSTFNRG